MANLSCAALGGMLVTSIPARADLRTRVHASPAIRSPQSQNRSPGPAAPAPAWRRSVIRAFFLSPLSRKAGRATFLIIVTLMHKNNLSTPPDEEIAKYYL